MRTRLQRNSDDRPGKPQSALMSVFKGVRHDDAFTGFADGDSTYGCRPGQEAGLRNDG
jgi:hypothetical protein